MSGRHVTFVTSPRDESNDLSDSVSLCRSNSVLIASATDDEIRQAVSSILSFDSNSAVLLSRENSSSYSCMQRDDQSEGSISRSRQQEVLGALAKELSLFSIEEQPV